MDINIPIKINTARAARQKDLAERLIRKLSGCYYIPKTNYYGLIFDEDLDGDDYTVYLTVEDLVGDEYSLALRTLPIIRMIEPEVREDEVIVRKNGLIIERIPLAEYWQSKDTHEKTYDILNYLFLRRSILSENAKVEQL